MYGTAFDRQTLLFEIKILKDRVHAFETGEKYVRMEKLHKAAREGDFRTIERLRKEVEQVRAEKKHAIEIWYDTCVDIQEECDKKLDNKEKECQRRLEEKDKLIIRLQ